MATKPWKLWGLLDSQVMLDFLITRATERAARKGHMLSPWTQAKRKHGKGSRQSTCLTCGRQCYVLPYGKHFEAKIASGNPGVGGPAVSQACGK